MTKKRFVMGIALVLALAIVGVIMAQPGTMDNGQLTSGGSNQGQNSATRGPGGTPGIGSTGRQLTPTTASNARGTPTPSVQPVDPGKLTTERKAFILLNPATGTPGSSIGVTGAGFDPGTTIDLGLKRKADDKPQDLGFAQVDQGGGFGGFSFALPDTYTSGSFIVVAVQHNGGKSAEATGQVRGNSPLVKFGTQVGKPGDEVTFSAKGFAPQEDVKTYFNNLTGDPIQTFKSDGSGGLQRGSVKVPYGAVGNNSFIFMGDKSQSPVTVQFLMLSLYPTVGLSSYASKADTVLTFTGTDFGPEEEVNVFLNSTSSPAVAKFKTDNTGGFKDAGGFLIPFELRGKHTFLFVGEKSQATTTTGFDVLPYTPTADPSTYGGRPGTSVTFYGAGFARNEIVRVYVGKQQNSAGREVACFKTNDQGAIVGGGTAYTIQPDSQPGELLFSLIGSKSQATAVAAVEVMEATGPVQGQTPAEQKEYICPYDNESQGSQQPILQTPVPASPKTPIANPTRVPTSPTQVPSPTKVPASPTPIPPSPTRPRG